jgi:hypothetical protein
LICPTRGVLLWEPTLPKFALVMLWPGGSGVTAYTPAPVVCLVVPMPVATFGRHRRARHRRVGRIEHSALNGSAAFDLGARDHRRDQQERGTRERRENSNGPWHNDS